MENGKENRFLLIIVDNVFRGNCVNMKQRKNQKKKYKLKHTHTPRGFFSNIIVRQNQTQKIQQ